MTMNYPININIIPIELDDSSWHLKTLVCKIKYMRLVYGNLYSPLSIRNEIWTK